MAATTTADWIEAIGTVSAVVVALFAPGIRTRLSRPELTIAQDDRLASGISVWSDDDDTKGQTRTSLLVANRRGRATAVDVRAKLTVYLPFGPIDDIDVPATELPSIERRAMRFELAPRPDTRVDIPSGADEALSFVVLGPPAGIDDLLADQEDAPRPDDAEYFAAFNVWPAPGTASSLALPHAQLTTVEVTLSGANVDAAVWAGQIEVTGFDINEDGDIHHVVELEWRRPLARRRRDGFLKSNMSRVRRRLQDQRVKKLLEKADDSRSTSSE